VSNAVQKQLFGTLFIAAVMPARVGKPKQKVKDVAFGDMVSLALSVVVGAACTKLCCHMQS